MAYMLRAVAAEGEGQEHGFQYPHKFSYWHA